MDAKEREVQADRTVGVGGHTLKMLSAVKLLTALLVRISVNLHHLNIALQLQFMQSARVKPIN